MALNFLLKRSGTASKRPTAASMALGEIDLNYDATTGGLYYKDSAGAVVKVGPCQVSATAPNSSPAGSSGNSAGEFWYDTANSALKVYNGTSWVVATSTSAFLPLAGGTMTGNITFNGAQTFPVSGIQSASTTQSGVVQLNDTVTSTSTTQALTANQGKNLQDQINSLTVSSNLTFAGTINGSTGLMLTVTTEGSAKGFTVGSAMPSAAAGNAEYFTIVTEPGTMTPPGGSAQAVNDGDWWLSTGSAYSYLAVGYSAPYASTTASGVVQLATNAEVQAGSETTHAVTSSGLQSKLSDSTSTTSSTTIASSTAVKAAYDAAVAAQGSADSKVASVSGTSPITVDNTDPLNPIVEIDSASTTTAGAVQLNDTVSSTSTTEAATANAVKTAYDLANNAIPDGTLTTTGDIIYASAASTPSRLGIGSTGQVLTVSGGLPVWATGMIGATDSLTPFNTKLGYNAGLGFNAATLRNTAIGYAALDLETTGDDLTAIGYNALGTTNIGTSWTVAIGSSAGENIAHAAHNSVFIGWRAGQNATAGISNIAIGSSAGRTLAGSNNVVVGQGAGAAAAVTNNVFVGNNAGAASTGSGNVYIGAGAGDVTSATSNNIAIGLNALGGSSTASGSVAIGNESMLVATSGIRNTAVGYQTLRALNSGQENTVVGYNAGLLLTTGSANVFVGNDVGDAITTGTYNTAVGSTALGAATTANSNTAIGWGALNAATGASNTAVGKGAGLLVSTGTNNVLIGDGAGDAITTGASNTILGDVAGTTTLSNNLILAAGTTIKLQVNENGAVGVGSTPAYGSSGQILMSNGTGSAPTWTSSAGLLPNYGEFYSTQTQTNLDTTNGNAVTLNTTDASRNFSIVSNSRITAAVAGTYNLMTSIQFFKDDAGIDDVRFWIKVNGTNVANSTTNLTLQGNNVYQLGTVNWLLNLNAGDYVEIWWHSLDTQMQLLAELAASPYPAIPSVIATIVPVGA